MHSRTFCAELIKFARSNSRLYTNNRVVPNRSPIVKSIVDFFLLFHSVIYLSQYWKTGVIFFWNLCIHTVHQQFNSTSAVDPITSLPIANTIRRAGSIDSGYPSAWWNPPSLQRKGHIFAPFVRVRPVKSLLHSLSERRFCYSDGRYLAEVPWRHGLDR